MAAGTAAAAAGKAGSALKSGLGYLWGSKKEEKKEETTLDSEKYRADQLTVAITVSGTDKVLATGKGSWLSYVEFEGAVTWRIEQPLPKWEEAKDTLSDGTRMLPSDSIRRTDVGPMREG